MGFNVATNTNDDISTLEISIGVNIIFNIEGGTPQTVVEGTAVNEKKGADEEVITTPGKEDPTTTDIKKEDSVTPKVEKEDPIVPEVKKEDPIKPEVEKEDPIKPKVKKEDPIKPEVKKEDPIKPEVKKEDPIKPKAGTGPVYYTHVSGRSGHNSYPSSNTYELTCPACAFYYGKADAMQRREVERKLRSGVHVENNKVVKEPKITPVGNYKGSDDIVHLVRIDGESSRRRGSPDFGLDVLCPRCAWRLGFGRGDLNIVRQGRHTCAG